MGCLCCKPSAIEESRESPRERVPCKASVPNGRREEAYRAKDPLECNDVKTMLIDKQANGSVRLQNGKSDRRSEKGEYIVTTTYHPGMGTLPKATEGEQVAAGWPSWLAAVAGEAIRGWVPRRADSFEKLDKVCFFPPPFFFFNWKSF